MSYYDFIFLTGFNFTVFMVTPSYMDRPTNSLSTPRYNFGRTTGRGTMPIMVNTTLTPKLIGANSKILISSSTGFAAAITNTTCPFVTVNHYHHRVSWFTFFNFRGHPQLQLFHLRPISATQQFTNKPRKPLISCAQPYLAATLVEYFKHALTPLESQESGHNISENPLAKQNLHTMD
jgi:hypothetical protein